MHEVISAASAGERIAEPGRARIAATSSVDWWLVPSVLYTTPAPSPMNTTGRSS
ncbi:MAG: hypothetical protein U0797_01195 [Gemmataceae bacterium]